MQVNKENARKNIKYNIPNQELLLNFNSKSTWSEIKIINKLKNQKTSSNIPILSLPDQYSAANSNLQNTHTMNMNNINQFNNNNVEHDPNDPNTDLNLSFNNFNIFSMSDKNNNKKK